MLSFKTELKKAAVVIQSHASGHGGHVGGLGISLLNQKLLEDSLNKVAENQQQASLSLVQWASEEDDHIMELFTKLADLEALHGQLYRRYSSQVESARQCYKAISKGEKHVQDLKKEYDTQQVKANKVRKQMESSKKKKEKDKVLEALDVELATAYSHESKAAEDLKIAKENHSKFKIMKVQEALRVTQKANNEFHSDAMELASIQDKIIKLFLGPEKEEYVAKAGVLASSYITTLSEKIGLPKPLSVADKQAGASFKTHQPLRTGSSSSTSSTSSRHSMPIYMDHPEKEIQRPPSNRADMPLPALPLYPSLTSGNSFDNDENGELYSEQYYSYTDVGDSHPSGILMGKHVENPPSYPPRPASSLPGSLRTRNSAPPTKHVDLTATDVQGNPLPPPPPDTPDQEYMSLVAEGIYDSVGNLQISPKQANKHSDDEEDYMSLQGMRPNEAKTGRGIHDEDAHIYDNRLNEAYDERI